MEPRAPGPLEWSRKYHFVRRVDHERKNSGKSKSSFGSRMDRSAERAARQGEETYKAARRFGARGGRKLWRSFLAGRASWRSITSCLGRIGSRDARAAR